MQTISTLHRTTYVYHNAVTLGVQKLFLRPRETREHKLVSHEIRTTPDAELTWVEDVMGNSVAQAAFRIPTDRMVVESRAVLESRAPLWPIFPISAGAIEYPFFYSAEEWTDLGALTQPVHQDEDGRFARWIEAFVRGRPTDTLSLLKDISAGIAAGLEYEVRDEKGTRSPVQTLDHGRGSCRDFATMVAEAARHLGLGARLVSGYLFDPGGDLSGSADAGSTHAWTEIYLPGAGWIAFDPTNRSLGSAHLVAVAVARDITQIVPVSGSFSGGSDALLRMDVEVRVLPGEADRAMRE